MAHIILILYSTVEGGTHAELQVKEKLARSFFAGQSHGDSDPTCPSLGQTRASGEGRRKITTGYR
ncbi:MAG: hypothetical protein Q9161_006462, partial [Pseudevernia consocians]